MVREGTFLGPLQTVTAMTSAHAPLSTHATVTGGMPMQIPGHLAWERVQPLALPPQENLQRRAEVLTRYVYPQLSIVHHPTRTASVPSCRALTLTTRREIRARVVAPGSCARRWHWTPQRQT